ncbi:anti-sigma factor [Mesorhizobium sp. M7A.F.Ca.CA.001.09.2.1]|uniref:Anti-sigma factor n=1 Tax=Mesorhizobium ciceri TaxID=39645 RepID=A0AB38T8G3_9HYPH|nr:MULTISPECIES: anti-sigma factor [Mesorhizobium]MDF3153195.1 anti-sigma factor [Mesorhizobium sp. XAP10]MDF3216589.1 anti-sigma factor [Mesorhizobium ciceri]MDF3246507.1 anti-sigma factor [Mesorhizobium sp. XAP4]RUY60296.1 anti-sigma factor [Mesorhizobium sp. M7A.F.Ca.CA.001.13.1.1]RUY65972.1 anti-sigma factor [Mesorhizobium sp. M7A.F.Ca.CA.001.05.1.1]
MIRRDFSERDIHMALDGELPADERAAYDAWLDANPEMKARSARFTADRTALRAAFAGVLDEAVPARLRKVVLGEAPVKAAVPRSRWWLAAAVLLVAAGGLGGYLAGVDGIGQEDPAEDRLAEQAIAAHVIYAAEKRHAVEVPASDKDHLQTWLSNRVGLKLVAPDLTANGFQLVGGRLLPAGESKAAMLLYEDGNGQRISLFVTTESTENAKGTYAATQDGPEAVYWLDKGYGCAVVGSLPRERLNEVARNAYTQLVNGLAS